MSAEAELQSGVKTSQRRESRRIKGTCNTVGEHLAYHGWIRTKSSKTPTNVSMWVVDRLGPSICTPCWARRYHQYADEGLYLYSGGAFLGAAEHGARRLIPLIHMFVTSVSCCSGSVVLSDVIGPDVLHLETGTGLKKKDDASSFTLSSSLNYPPRPCFVANE